METSLPIPMTARVYVDLPEGKMFVATVRQLTAPWTIDDHCLFVGMRLEAELTAEFRIARLGSFADRYGLFENRVLYLPQNFIGRLWP